MIGLSAKIMDGEVACLIDGCRGHYNDALRVEVFGRTKDMTPDAAAKAGLDSSLLSFVRPEFRKAEGINNER